MYFGKYRCPPTEDRRARVGFTEEEADAHEAQRLMQDFTKQTQNQDTYRSMLRICRTHLVGKGGAIATRTLKLIRAPGGGAGHLGGGRAATMLSFLESVAEELLRTLNVLMWTPVYLYCSFCTMPGSRAGAREIALVNNGCDSLAKQVLGLARLIAASDVKKGQVDMRR